MDLADKIKRLRDEKGWTQKGLADAAGVSQQTIDKIENRNSLKPRYLPEIATALGKTVEDLLEGIDMPARKKQSPPKRKVKPRSKWPFKGIDYDRFDRLDETKKLSIESLVGARIASYESGSAKKSGPHPRILRAI